MGNNEYSGNKEHGNIERYDNLTGLPNRVYFSELAAAGCCEMNKNGQKPVFLFLDLSGMKFYNQKHGFEKGDALLLSFSGLLVTFFDKENCSRFEQDHFVVYTEETHVEEKIHDLFDEWQRLNDSGSLSVRVGIYSPGDEELDVSSACDCAKLACDTLRNTYVSAISYYDKSLQDDFDRHHYIITNIDKAISEGWIKVYYQPIVRAINGYVCDEEALARWIDPVNGFMSPGDFIPILEESKLIYKLDLFIVDEIIKKIRAIKEAGLNAVPQSVNLSRTDFDACDIVQEICSRIDAAGIGHDMLTIEITESIVGTNFEFMKKQVERFRELGFQVWMDDFGSGYSSLDVLQSLEFDLIKFDMRFVQQLDEEGKGKIILTELMRMATALGLETVCEGVEKKEHVEFLKEIGCAKLQGYYFAKPMPLDQIFERYEKGIQIGFENPDESQYYETIGRINLYDLSVIANEGNNSLSRYFSNLPMAIMEIDEDKLIVTRSNQSYRDYIERQTGQIISDDEAELSAMNEERVAYFIEMINYSDIDTTPIFIDERLPNKSTVHTYFRKIATNPVTGNTAVAVVILAITDDSEGITYANIARSLATDYVNLFYVNLETEDFIEYSSNLGKEELAVERHGRNFFAAAREDAAQYLYEPDVEPFVAKFTKEYVMDSLEKQGTFALTYRMKSDDLPVYVMMKAMKMSHDDGHIIIGVSSIDNQMKQKEIEDKTKTEQMLYKRFSALAGNYICIYSVDIKTDHYIECSSTSDYDNFGLAKFGEDFFERANIDAKDRVYPDDQALIKAVLTKDNVLNTIENKGFFELQYRLLINGEPQKVHLKAVKVNEDDGDKLIIGVSI